GLCEQPVGNLVDGAVAPRGNHRLRSFPGRPRRQFIRVARSASGPKLEWTEPRQRKAPETAQGLASAGMWVEDDYTRHKRPAFRAHGEPLRRLQGPDWQ